MLPRPVRRSAAWASVGILAHSRETSARPARPALRLGCPAPELPNTRSSKEVRARSLNPNKIETLKSIRILTSVHEEFGDVAHALRISAKV